MQTTKARTPRASPALSLTLALYTSGQKLKALNTLSDKVNPTFEAWRLQIQGNLHTDIIHYLTKEDKMFFIFFYTTSTAQKGLLAYYDKDSYIQFVLAKEIIKHLATLFVNLNKA